jgi:hypothetical protein
MRDLPVAGTLRAGTRDGRWVIVATVLGSGMACAEDVLRGVHWYVPRSEGEDDLERGVYVDEADIPTAQAVHALARAAAQRNQVWWRELELSQPLDP